MSATISPPTPVIDIGDAYRRPDSWKKKLLRLDQNEGPRSSDGQVADLIFGCSESAIREYPSTEELASDIADWIGTDPETIVVGTGADDMIDRSLRAYAAGSPLLCHVPTFEMLERYARLNGCRLERIAWDAETHDGAFPIDDFVRRLDRVGSVAIVSPNNPTGLAAMRDDIDRVARAAAEKLVLLDHAYVEFADEDLTSLSQEFPNVVVVRTLSKAWGLAGLRVGYAVCAPSVAGVLRAAGAPYPVSGVAVEAARRRLRDRPGMKLFVEQARREREDLEALLQRNGVRTGRSQANFVMARLPGRSDFVQSAFESLGIAVRSFPNRPELSDVLRISTPGNQQHFERLMNATRAILSPEAILLDMDGVLADVTNSYQRCIAETAAAFGVTVTPDDIQSLKMRGNANNDWVVTHRLIGDGGITVSLSEVTAIFQELYGELRSEETLIPDIDVLRRLADALPLGVVTGRPRTEAMHFLTTHGLEDLFKVVVAMEDAPAKPSAEPLIVAHNKLGVSATWMVGDTPDDILAACRAGSVPIGVPAPGANSANPLMEAGAAIVIDSLDQLPGLLNHE